MPEVTTCPDCDKKLKVPDRLIGKKVRCPGCASMFTAKADGAGGDELDDVEEEDAPQKAKAGARKDAISDRKSSPRRDDDEDDRPRSRGRRDDEDDDRRPSRRDDDDRDRDRDRGRSRGFQRSDDRLSRSDRDEDDRPARRSRREEDDHERRPSRGGGQASGWRGLRIGVYLVVFSNWLYLGACAEVTVGAGLFMFFSAQAFMDLMAGEGGGFGTALQAGAMLYLIAGLYGLLWLAAKILELLGMGLSIQVPTKRGPTMRVLIIVALACCGLAFLIGLGNRFAVHSQMITGVCGLLELGGFICWLIALRMAALELGDDALAGKFLFFLIAYVCFVVLSTSVLVIMFYVSIATVFMGAAGGGDPFARAGTMIVVMWTLVMMSVVGYCVLIAWYSVLLQRLRGVLTARVGE